MSEFTDDEIIKPVDKGNDPDQKKIFILDPKTGEAVGINEKGFEEFEKQVARKTFKRNLLRDGRIVVVSSGVIGSLLSSGLIGGLIGGAIRNKQSNESRLKDGILNNQVKQHGTNEFRDNPARPQVIRKDLEPVNYENKKYVRQSPFMNRVNTLGL